LKSNKEFMNEKIVIEKEGKLVECNVLFTFEVRENNRVYVGYTDEEFDGRKNLYISYFDPAKGHDTLNKVTTANEIELFKQVLAYAKGE
jgi:hypothetical protein